MNESNQATWSGVDDLPAEEIAELEARAEELRKVFDEFDPDVEDDRFEVSVNPELLNLARLARQQQKAQPQIDAAVQRVRDAGHSWATVADCLGISWQAAKQRYGATAGETV